MTSFAVAIMTAAFSQPLTPVPFTDVKFTEGFWAERLAVVRDATLRANFHQCEITGRVDNLAIAGGQKQGVYKGYFFNDSDVYKAIEGAAYVLAQLPEGQARTDLDKRLDDLIATIAAAQQPDGYINSYFQTKDANPEIKDTDAKWSNTPDKHEMYCMGHLIEAGVAHYRATGKRSLLNVAIKAADHIDSVFGPPPRRPDVCGHEEIELALIRLWQLGRDDKAAGIGDDERYLRLAEHFIASRGAPVSGRASYGEHCQDHAPLKNQTEVVGHAVRAMYLFCAATELALKSARELVSDSPAGPGPLITDHGSLVAPLTALWTDLTGRKMYVTGGIGNSGHNEGFTKPYDLPNDTAYAETCATIGLAMWAHRMNLLTADARYFDVLERALYNGILSGLTLDGAKFFYENPLGSTGDHHRKDWYACACCPPNILRFLASLGGMAYAVDDSLPGPTIYVNLYGAGEATVPLPKGTVKLTQETRYPWEGKVRIRVEPSTAGMEFQLAVRIPGWCEGAELDASDRFKNPGPRKQLLRGGTYETFHGAWKARETVELQFPMPVRRVHAHPSVPFDRGRVALQRGPMVFCMEDADNRAGARSIALPPDAEAEAEFRSNLLGGVTVLMGDAIAMPRQDWDEGELYRPAPEASRVRFTAVPYFAWDNRDPGGMQVWIPESAALAPLGPLRGVTPSASHCWPSDTVAAMTDRQEPANSADHNVPRHTFWPRKGTTDWVQLDFDRAQCLSGLDVYWFDDGPPAAGGQCRVPKAWSVVYRGSPDGDWVPVINARGLTADKDRYNRVRFDPIEAFGVRIAVELQPEYSGGVLEVRPVK